MYLVLQLTIILIIFNKVGLVDSANFGRGLQSTARRKLSNGPFRSIVIRPIRPLILSSPMNKSMVINEFEKLDSISNHSFQKLPQRKSLQIRLPYAVNKREFLDLIKRYLEHRFKSRNKIKSKRDKNLINALRRLIIETASKRKDFYSAPIIQVIGNYSNKSLVPRQFVNTTWTVNKAQTKNVKMVNERNKLNGQQLNMRLPMSKMEKYSTKKKGKFARLKEFSSTLKKMRKMHDKLVNEYKMLYKKQKYFNETISGLERRTNPQIVERYSTWKTKLALTARLKKLKSNISQIKENRRKLLSTLNSWIKENEELKKILRYASESKRARLVDEKKGASRGAVFVESSKIVRENNHIMREETNEIKVDQQIQQTNINNSLHIAGIKLKNVDKDKPGISANKRFKNLIGKIEREEVDRLIYEYDHPGTKILRNSHGKTSSKSRLLAQIEGTQFSEKNETEDKCEIFQCDFEDGSLCKFKTVHSSRAKSGTNSSALRIKSWKNLSGRFGNFLTGIALPSFFPQKNKRFIAVYLRSKEIAKFAAALPNGNGYTIRYHAWEATTGLQLRLCCDNILQCIVNTELGANMESRSWREYTAICPNGTSKIVFICENYGTNQGACGLDNVRVINNNCISRSKN